VIEKKNGAVVRDLTTDETETGNVYVVAPVPPSVQKAMNVTTKAPRSCSRSRSRRRTQARRRGSARIPTDGQLGVEIDWIGNYMGNGGRRCGPTQEKPCNRGTNQTEDFELYSPSRFGQLGRPLYKPEYWDKVQQLDMWTNKYDPVMTCQPLGVPRQGRARESGRRERHHSSELSWEADAGVRVHWRQYQVEHPDRTTASGAENADLEQENLHGQHGRTLESWGGGGRGDDTLVHRTSIGFIDRPGSDAARVLHTQRTCTSSRESSGAKATRIFYDASTVEAPAVV
jgi:hypothetical protein